MSDVARCLKLCLTLAHENHARYCMKGVKRKIIVAYATSRILNASVLKMLIINILRLLDSVGTLLVNI